MKGKISMVEIAEMSGVSIATVSRVLNHNGRFSSETERKVMNIVNNYGYKVNLNAKGLRTNKTPVSYTHLTATITSNSILIILQI